MMRVDSYLVSGGFAESRERAKHLIVSGCVTVDGRVPGKPAEPVDESLPHAVEVHNTEKYVGRGGYKLEAALDAFRLQVAGTNCLDIGASTGGFTDCLLQNGASHVVALDAGEGQLHARLRNDSRVLCLEHYNARELSPDDVGGEKQLVVLDVSFISQTYILPRIPVVLSDGGYYVGLVKPQFEAGKSAVGKGGIVKRLDDRIRAIERVYTCGVEAGLCPVGLIPSPIEGGDGNIEYLICFRKQEGAGALSLTDISRMIKR